MYQWAQVTSMREAAGQAYSVFLEENDIYNASKMEERLDHLMQDAMAIGEAMFRLLLKPTEEAHKTLIIMGAPTDDLLQRYYDEDDDDSMLVLEELHSRAMSGDKAAQEVLNDHDRDEPGFTPQTGSETR